MKGIQFVTDERGQKTAVLIDLKTYGELWEDFYDSLIAAQRVDEPRETLAEVRRRLQRQGKLDG
jgi:PHD/YefM family antitoxin component YafN of YafNO toxin-antitoxin module